MMADPAARSRQTHDWVKPSTTIFCQIIFGDVIYFRPNPIRKHRKTQTQPQKSILIHQTPFLMSQNSILIPQKLFLDTKLKPRFWKLTLKGFGIRQRRWTWVMPNPQAVVGGRGPIWRHWVGGRRLPWVLHFGWPAFFLRFSSLLFLLSLLADWI